VTTCRNALTVDLEDWYHICGTGRSGDVSTWDAHESRVTRNTAKVLSLLREHRARATFFVLGYIAEREPGLIADIAKEGHEIATHGHYHRRVFEMSEEEFAEDVDRSMEAISSAGGCASSGTAHRNGPSGPTRCGRSGSCGGKGSVTIPAWSP